MMFSFECFGSFDHRTSRGGLVWYDALHGCFEDLLSHLEPHAWIAREKHCSGADAGLIHCLGLFGMVERREDGRNRTEKVFEFQPLGFWSREVVFDTLSRLDTSVQMGREICKASWYKPVPLKRLSKGSTKI